MEEKFLAFAAEILNTSTDRISMDTKYKEFEPWDSLMMINLIMETEAEYGVSIPIERVGEIQTLRDLYRFAKG